MEMQRLTELLNASTRAQSPSVPLCVSVVKNTRDAMENRHGDEGLLDVTRSDRPRCTPEARGFRP
jgi:hypothetical protein